jgi:AraC family transcriptional regulator of adaptative response/methylated-DNA-[protein]-cysteine methyltransferase
MKEQTLPPEKEMYTALIKKDSSYVGIFWVGVKSTGVFCKPTCTARKPKEENVEYFSSVRNAIYSGYRACKVCKPLNLKGDSPEWFVDLIAKIDEGPTKRWRDYDLVRMNLNPNKVRRWFKKNYDMTFHAHLRSKRLGHAIGRIKHGESVTKTAFGHGFESLSGFADAIKNLSGTSPGSAKDKTLIYINRIETPLGPMVSGATDNGLCLLEFADRRMLETQLKRLVKWLKGLIVAGENKFIQQVSRELKKYFSGDLKKFSVQLVLPGTEFQKSVWNELVKIPYGETSTYEKIAEQIKNPKSVRAVGTANGDNRLAIIIPCHRVIGKDGKLHGYGGGLWRKQKLLEIENAE